MVERAGSDRPRRLGVVSYLNSEPLVYGLAADPRFALERAVPAVIADRLHAGALDLGLIPSIEYARGGYAIVPGLAIASRGAVRSVRLFHAVDLPRVRRVALDTSSRTSAALLRIVLRARLGRDPEYVPGTPPLEGMLAQADAALVIGDPALAAGEAVASLDLGEAWADLTGLPFVYAFWAGRIGSVSAEHVRALQAALVAGQGAVADIAAAYNGRGAATAAENEAYLRRHVSYQLGGSELAGLSEFYRRARELGLIERLPDLRFHAA